MKKRSESISLVHVDRGVEAVANLCRKHSISATNFFHPTPSTALSPRNEDAMKVAKILTDMHRKSLDQVVKLLLDFEREHGSITTFKSLITYVKFESEHGMELTAITDYEPCEYEGDVYEHAENLAMEGGYSHE